MKETIFKIGKILGIVIIVIIALAVLASFVTRGLYNATSSGKQYSVDSEIGLGSSDNLLWGAVDSVSESLTRSKADSTPSAVPSQYQGEGDLTQKKIIKNANLRIYVKDAEITAGNIQELTLKLNGFVNESNVYKSSDGTKSGNVTVRVPVKSFEVAVENIKKLAKEVESESIDSEDVTEQYVDFEAQLRNLRAEEAQYLQIMQNAFNINDTLSVANRLSDVRGRIERIQGQLQYLERQVDMSTIRITLTADSDVEVFGLRWRPLIVAKRALKNMFLGLAEYVDAMIAFVFILPVVIVWIVTVIVVLVIIFKLLRWLYYRFFRWHRQE